MVVFAYVITCQCLQNSGGEIKWSHLVELAEKSTSNTGLYIGKKLTREHLILTSYSRMNVRLAAQVKSVMFSCNHNYLALGVKHFSSKWI